MSGLSSIKDTPEDTPHTMASSLTIDSKVKLNSGHEIPLLGYGLYQT